MRPITTTTRSLALAALSALSLASAAARADDRHWINSAGGAFSDPMNWLGGVVPGATDNALFETLGAFPITFAADVLTSRLAITGGSMPTFSLGAHTYSMTSFSGGVEMWVGDDSTNNRLTILGGTLSTPEATVGPLVGGVSEMIVSGPDALFNVSLLGVGGWVGLGAHVPPGAGSLRIEGGGRLTTGAAYLAFSSEAGSSGSIVVDGAGSQWACQGQVRLGRGAAEISIVNGGTATLHGLSTQPNPQSYILVDGLGSSLSVVNATPGGSPVRLWIYGGVRIDVANGASLNAEDFQLNSPSLGDPGQSSTGTLDGAATTAITKTLALGSLVAGADFSVTNGASLIANAITIDSPFTGVGALSITGEGSRVQLAPPGTAGNYSLHIGTSTDSFARLHVSDSAVIRHDDSLDNSAFSANIFSGEVTVRGLGSAIGDAESGLVRIDIGALDPVASDFTPGFGRLVVAAGATIACEQIRMWHGEITGDGLIEGPVNCLGGAVRPGDPHGALTIEGTYTQFTAGALEIELVDAERNEAPDRLIVTGTATLAGTLQVRMVDDFDPPVGSVFPAISAGSVVGTFDTIDAPLKNNKVAHIEYKADAVNIRIALLGDINADGVTNAFDLSMLFSLWGTNDPTADLNADGIVNSQDLGLLLGAWTH